MCGRGRGEGRGGEMGRTERGDQAEGEPRDGPDKAVRIVKDKTVTGGITAAQVQMVSGRVASQKHNTS